MTARFGRNKRRRAREQLAAAVSLVRQTQEALQREHMLLLSVSDNLAKARDEIETAKRRVGRFSAIFTPEGLHVPGVRRELINVPVDLGMEELLARLPPPTEYPMHALTAMPLPTMLTDRVVDQIKGYVHVRVRFADNGWAYAVERNTLKVLDQADRERALTVELARLISRDIGVMA